MDRIRLDGRLGFSLDLSRDEFQVLTGSDRVAARELLAKLVQSKQCTIVGDTYFPVEWNEDVLNPVMDEKGLTGLDMEENLEFDLSPICPAAAASRYKVARDVAIEDFKNELECLGYRLGDYSEEVLRGMYEEFYDKLATDSTYNAIYSGLADDVARKQEAINQRVVAEAEYDESGVVLPEYGDFPTLEEIKRDYYALMDIIKGVKTVGQAREVEKNYGISVEINGVSIDEFENGLKTINGRADGRGTNADIEWIRYEAYGCLSYVYDWFGGSPMFDVWSNAASCEFVTDITIDDLNPENYASWVSNEVERLNEQGVKLRSSVDALIKDAANRGGGDKAAGKDGMDVEKA